MIVRHFLQWVRTAEAAERAEATSALSRAYLYSELSHEDRVAAEGAMIMLLDDPSPLVRFALADALASSPNAPSAVMHALVNDQPDIAVVVLERSPLLLDTDLVDAIAVGSAETQCAIARRMYLPPSVSAAIAEVAGPEACLTLIENSGADIATFSLDRIVARFGHLAAIRESLLSWPDLPAATRHTLVMRLTQALTSFVVASNWLEEGRAQRIAQEACEKATVIMAGTSCQRDVSPLVSHLRQTGQLTAGLVLRSLLSGNIEFFEHALCELSGLPIRRVTALLHDRRGASFKALYERAGLPESVYPAFHSAVDAMHEHGMVSEVGGTTRLKRRMVERVLTSCAGMATQDVEPLMALLRRYQTEAAREEARLFCDELVEMGNVVVANDIERMIVAA
jgi:uncharacterized protein (DUF2336 family)